MYHNQRLHQQSATAHLETPIHSFQSHSLLQHSFGRFIDHYQIGLGSLLDQSIDITSIPVPGIHLSVVLVMVFVMYYSIASGINPLESIMAD